MGDILSQDEIDALLSAVADGDAVEEVEGSSFIEPESQSFVPQQQSYETEEQEYSTEDSFFDNDDDEIGDRGHMIELIGPDPDQQTDL